MMGSGATLCEAVWRLHCMLVQDCSALLCVAPACWSSPHPECFHVFHSFTCGLACRRSSAARWCGSCATRCRCWAVASRCCRFWPTSSMPRAPRPATPRQAVHVKLHCWFAGLFRVCDLISALPIMAFRQPKGEVPCRACHIFVKFVTKKESVSGGPPPTESHVSKAKL